MVEVMQEDREAAARYLVAIVPETPVLAARVMESQTALSRAFARHRIAARKQALDEAARALKAAQFSPAPYTDGMSAIRALSDR